MASETRGRVDKNVQRRQINVMRKADGVYLMDHSIMSAVVFMKGNNLCIYENKDDWLLPALQNGKLVI
jgi:hypothetical protein